jgi:hypothetical protein
LTVLMSLLECLEATLMHTWKESLHQLKFMLANVDFNMKFIYLLVEWKGSFHDATILTDSLEKPNDNQTRCIT